MHVDILCPHALFQKDVRYEIPEFQRPYVWEQETQWEPLWNDVRNIAEEYLDSGKNQPHFMGAVVLQQQLTATNQIETRIVVDGQQRLITIQLLLDAVQEVFERRNDDDSKMPARRLSLMVKNDEVYCENDHDCAFKIWPALPDTAAFRHAMHNDLPSAVHEESLIVQAHDFFKDQVSLWLDAFPEQSKARIGALEKTVCRLLEFVVIDLESTDEPHIIFETLNARGTPLLQSDLVKNLVLYKDASATVHLQSFDDKWWRKEITQGRLQRPRIDVFLNYWIVARKHEEINANNVFTAFRQYAEKDNAKPILDIATDIGRLGKIYRNLEEDLYAEIATFLYRRQTMQVGVVTPVLLWLFSSDVSKQQIEKGLRALESYLVRRMICHMTTKDYNKLFVALVSALEKQGATVAGDTIVEYLLAQEAHVRQWPGDQMLENAFLTTPLYRLLTRGRLRLVLEGIEEALRTKQAESQSVPRKLTIEHVMPQQWRQNWPLPEDTEDKAKMAAERDRQIHTIGNLTLVNHRLNPTLSNAPWGEKRKKLAEHSVLFLNKTLLDTAPVVWDEAAITERARQLFMVASKVWPSAENI